MVCRSCCPRKRALSTTDGGEPVTKKGSATCLTEPFFNTNQAIGLFPLADIDEMAGNRGGSSHGWRDKVRAALEALTTLEIPVGR